MTVGLGAVTWRSVGVGLWLVVGGLVLAASSGGVVDGAGVRTAPVTGGSPVRADPVARAVALTLSPPDQAVGVAPGEAVAVAAAGGRLTRVVLTNQEGQVVAGELAADGTSWRSTEPLGYGKSYTTTVAGAGEDGGTATATSTFTTAKAPRRQASLSMNPLDGQTVGVGQPLSFYFDSPVADKAAAERAIQITAEPATVGAFNWFDDKTVHWRPRDYWRAGTRITINAAVYGKHLGNGIFGKQDRRAAVTVGDALIATADGASHQMTVTVNGQVVRTVPISMGKRGKETPSGTFVAMSEHTNYTMDSSTYGVPADSANGYRTTVAVATRLSNSGIFYHSAPWSVRQQGSSNVSHGCINMSTENARWLQSISTKGDIYVVTNSGGAALEPTDGLGVWQIPWETWRAGGKK